MHNIQNIKFFDFDWDQGNQLKCEKHGVSSEEIEFLILSDPDVFLDVKHSLESEQRFLAIGLNQVRRYLLVVFTIRKIDSKNYVRPISARYMHKKEVDYYEKEKKDS